MKKVFLICAFLVGMSAISFAQGGGQRGGGTPEQRIERLKTQITGITDDQVAKLKVIYAAQTKSTDSLTAVNPDRAATRPQRTIITAATNAKVKAILTADQAKQFDALPQGGRGGGQGGAPAPAGN